MNIDLVSMFINLSQSLPSVQAMVSGLGYMVGICLFIVGFMRLSEAAGQGGKESHMAAIAYFAAGALLVYLPSSISALSNTFFGEDNILAYDQQTSDALYVALKSLIETTGMIWFVRGCVLLLRMGKPGIKDGSRGLFYIGAGILAMNIDNTVYAIEYSLNLFVTSTMDSGTTS